MLYMWAGDRLPLQHKHNNLCKLIVLNSKYHVAAFQQNVKKWDLGKRCRPDQTPQNTMTDQDTQCMLDLNAIISVKEMLN